MANVSFEWDMAGVAELCKSAGMRAVLADEAEAMAEGANAAATPKAAHVTEFRKPPFASRVDVLDYTAVGVAHVNSTPGAYLQRKHHLLDAQRH